MTAVHHIHPVLVRHREGTDIDDLSQVLQHAVALFQQPGVPEGDGVQFLREKFSSPSIFRKFVT